MDHDHVRGSRTSSSHLLQTPRLCSHLQPLCAMLDCDDFLDSGSGSIILCLSCSLAAHGLCPELAEKALPWSLIFKAVTQLPRSPPMAVLGMWLCPALCFLLSFPAHGHLGFLSYTFTACPPSGPRSSPGLVTSWHGSGTNIWAVPFCLALIILSVLWGGLRMAPPTSLPTAPPAQPPALSLLTL